MAQAARLKAKPKATLTDAIKKFPLYAAKDPHLRRRVETKSKFIVKEIARR